MEIHVIIDSGQAYLEPSRKYSASYRKDPRPEMAECEGWSVFAELSQLLRKAEEDGFPLL